MKKVLVLGVAMSLYVMSAGTSFADDSESTVSALDTQAVWTKTPDDNNRPGTKPQAEMSVPEDSTQVVSKETTGTFPQAELEAKHHSSPKETSAIEPD